MEWHVLFDCSDGGLENNLPLRHDADENANTVLGTLKTALY